MVRSRMFLGAALTGLTLIAAGCGSDEGEGENVGESATEAPTSSELMDPQAFAGRVAAPDVVTINVHTPNEGSIAGTDLTIPFDEVASSTELPDDRSTQLAVYCRSGNMSADAIDDLEALGYTDIAELDGGFDAWRASGRPLEPAA